MAGEWIETILGELVSSGDAHLQTGPFGTALKAEEYSADGVPLISVGEVRQGYFEISDKTPRVSAETINRLPRFVLKTGDIVFGRKGGIDRNAIVMPSQQGWFLGSDGIRLRLSDKHSGLFFSYQMRSPNTRAWLLQNSEGTTMPSLNQEILGRVPIVVPPLPEQKAIAAILGALDDKIELNRRMNATLEAMARALFQSWFVDFDPVRANVDCRPQICLDSDTAALFQSHFQDSSHGPIPAGWSVRELGEVVDVKHGYAFPGENFRDESTNNILLTPGNFAIGGGFKAAKFKYYDGIVPNEFVLSEHDLIVSMTDLSKASDTLGYAAWVPSAPPGHQFLHNQRLGKIIIRDQEAVNKSFLYRVLCGDAYRNEILASATGTTVKHTSPSRIRAFKTVFPPPPLMSLFERVTQPWQLRSCNNQSESRTLAALRDTLLPKLLSGEVRVGS